MVLRKQRRGTLAEGKRGLRWHDAVTEQPQSVDSIALHSLGHPINASTNRGFKIRSNGEIAPPPFGVPGSRREGSDPKRARVLKLGVPRVRLACGTAPSFWDVP